MSRWIYVAMHLLFESLAARRDARVRFLKAQVEILRRKLGGNRVVPSPDDRTRCRCFLGGGSAITPMPRPELSTVLARQRIFERNHVKCCRAFQAPGKLVTHLGAGHPPARTLENRLNAERSAGAPHFRPALVDLRDPVLRGRS